MASPLKWKVYDPDAGYIAAVRYASDAAALIAAGCYEGAVVKRSGRIVYRQDGTEGESYDAAARKMIETHNRKTVRYFIRDHGREAAERTFGSAAIEEWAS